MFGLASLLVASAKGPLQAITFANRPLDKFFVARQVADEFGWTNRYDPALELLTIEGKTLDPFAPKLSDNTYLISSSDLKKMGVRFTASSLAIASHYLSFAVGKKKVAVDLKHQILRAWQGQLLVYEWKVSSGREGKGTPVGNFTAGKKEEMHISSIYGSPMPFSVHITGNIFIHGSTMVGAIPGSHGCIRLPVMTTRNVAEEFYNWIEPGTPVKVTGTFNFAK